jgi:hypothetical protein
LRGSRWQALGDGGGKANEVTALAQHDDGSGPAVYAASGEQALLWPMTSHDRVEKWTGSSWLALGEQTDGFVNVLGSFDLGSGAELYAGGEFTAIDGVSASCIARWNGAAWQALGAGIGASTIATGVHAFAMHDDGLGLRLFVAGDFASAGGVGVGGIATWNGATWSDVGGGADGEIRALAVYEGELYAGGAFSTAGSLAANRIARWDGASWHDVGGGVSGNLHDGVFALAVFDDGAGAKLYAGGKFTSAGGNPASRIAVWDGATWTAMGAGADSSVLALAVHDDGFGAKLYAGGAFTAIGGVPAKRFARWTGAQWQALDDVTGGPVETLAPFEPAPGRSELWLAGNFTHAGGSVSLRVARWSETAPCAPTTYCTAKSNSLGCVPTIFATGTPSAVANNFRVKAANVLNNKSGLLFWGFAAKGTPFQGGFLCVQPPTIRTPLQDSAGNAPPDDCSGAYSFHWNASYINAQALAPGQRVFSQYWSRDPASASTTGLTDGLSFLIEP